MAKTLLMWPVLGAADLVPFATTVVAIDETTFDPIAHCLPSLRGTPPAERLPGKLAEVFDLRTQQWRINHQVADEHQNEKVPARARVANLLRGSLILADLWELAQVLRSPDRLHSVLSRIVLRDNDAHGAERFVFRSREPDVNGESVLA